MLNESFNVHIALVVVVKRKIMVLLNDWLEQWVECSVRVSTACINTHSRVRIFTPREDCLLEREAVLVAFVAELIPNTFTQVSREVAICVAKCWQAVKLLIRCQT